MEASLLHPHFSLCLVIYLRHGLMQTLLDVEPLLRARLL